jgi:hypothetical protein
MDVVLQHLLLGGMIEADRRQPAPVGKRPAGLARIDAAMAQQETLQVLARLAEHPHGGRSRPDKVAHRLMRLIRHPDGYQFASPMQLRQHRCVPAVGLDPVASSRRNE